MPGGHARARAGPRAGSAPVLAGSRRVMLGLAWLVYAYFGAMAQSFAPILPVVLADLRTTSTGGGMLLGAYPLMYVLSALVIGRVCDRLGVRTSTALGILVIAISMLLRSAAHTFGPMLFAAALLGVGGPVVSTVLPKLVAERFEGPARTIASGVYVTGPAVGGAIVVGLTTGAFIPLAGSWHALFLAYSVIGLVIAGGWLLLARDLAPPVPARFTGDAAAPAAAGTGGPPSRVWRMPEVWMVVLVGVAAFTITQGFTSWLPTLLQARGFSGSAAGALASASRLCQVPGSIGICYAATRLPIPKARKRTVLTLLVLSASSVAALGLPAGPVLYLALVVQGAALGAMLPLLMAIIMDLPGISPAQMAMAAALYFTVGQVAGAGAPVLIGALRDATGGFSAGLLFVAGAAIAALIPAARVLDASREPAAGAGPAE